MSHHAVEHVSLSPFPSMSCCSSQLMMSWCTLPFTHSCWRNLPCSCRWSLWLTKTMLQIPWRSGWLWFACYTVLLLVLICLMHYHLVSLSTLSWVSWLSWRSSEDKLIKVRCWSCCLLDGFSFALSRSQNSFYLTQSLMDDFLILLDIILQHTPVNWTCRSWISVPP